jgi:adenylate kinase
MKTHLVLIGLPGAGKGTQGQLIAEKLGIPFISSGDALRKELETDDEIAKEFKEYMNKGLLVPDEVVEEFLEEMLERYNLKKGFVFDGFPRTVHQADFIGKYLEKKGISLDAVLYLKISDEEIIKRISGRRVCPKCGAIYNIYYNPPKHDEICDVCGTPLIQREDDKECVVRKRLDVYKKETQPLINYYSDKNLLTTVDATGTVEEVQARLEAVLND